MATLIGYAGKVMIGANTVAELSNWKMDLSADMPDTTVFNTTGWKSVIPGLKEWSGSAEGNFDMSDTNGQLALQNALLNGTSLSLKLYVDGTHYYSGTAYIKKVAPEAAVDDAVKCAFDFQGSGALSYT